MIDSREPSTVEALSAGKALSKSANTSKSDTIEKR
jgi:hypothetical protein